MDMDLNMDLATVIKNNSNSNEYLLELASNPELIEQFKIEFKKLQRLDYPTVFNTQLLNNVILGNNVQAAKLLIKNMDNIDMKSLEYAKQENNPEILKLLNSKRLKANLPKPDSVSDPTASDRTFSGKTRKPVLGSELRSESDVSSTTKRISERNIVKTAQPNYKEYIINDLKNYSHQELATLYKYYQVNNINNLSNKILEKEFPKQIKGKCLTFILAKEKSIKEIDEKRKSIYNKFIKYENSVTEITPEILRQIFDEYDKQWFNNDLNNYIKKNNVKFEFFINGSTPGETFSTEGICFPSPSTTACQYKITIPRDHFGKVTGKKLVNVAGHYCKNQLECLLRVIEHEIIHLIIFMLCGDVVMTEEHDNLFQSLTLKLFNHTDYHHYIF